MPHHLDNELVINSFVCLYEELNKSLRLSLFVPLGQLMFVPNSYHGPVLSVMMLQSSAKTKVVVLNNLYAVKISIFSQWWKLLHKLGGGNAQQIAQKQKDNEMYSYMSPSQDTISVVNMLNI